jgi:myosin protein heavy chain
MQFTEMEQMSLFKVIAAVLHLGNLTFESERDDTARLTAAAQSSVEKLCKVLGVPFAEFTRSLLKPKIKAGKDWVTQARTVEQVYYSIEALARSLYERMFGELVERINQSIYTPSHKSTFIGVLDIAGFEIFEVYFNQLICS